MTRPLPKAAEIYRHFKGAYYWILMVGHHSETGEQMVVYQRLTEEETRLITSGCTLTAVKWGDVCIRPLNMFMSEVEHEKYPDVKQKYRFEKFEGENENI